MDENQILNKLFKAEYFELSLDVFKELFLSDLTLEKFIEYYKKSLFEKDFLNANYIDEMIAENKLKSDEIIKEEASNIYNKFTGLKLQKKSWYDYWGNSYREDYEAHSKIHDFNDELRPVLFLYLSDRYSNIKQIKHHYKNIVINDCSCNGFMIRIFDN